MQPSTVTTFLFTDLEGSTRLWEEAPERMRPALAQHDSLLRAAIARHRGTVVKMTGDGVHAAFADPADAVHASLELQQALVDAEAAHGVPLRVRCGVHLGADEYRDRDFFGAAVNRAARIMSAAHGGQVLVSQAVAERVGARLPSDATLRDLGVVRLRDLANPERVFQLVHPRLRAEFPALRSLEATPNNLPQQLTSFIGRGEVLAQARDLLARSRLLTLCGAGGLGKTRLSLQLAADVLDDFPDGVWFVELAPLRDASLVAQAVASVLHVKEEPGRPVIEALASHAKDRRVLLVLDNCEHLLGACADLVRALLQAGPALKVLASSREPLHLPGETTLPVPALAAPQDGPPLAPADLARFDAVRLFVERASAVAPGFSVDAGTPPRSRRSVAVSTAFRSRSSSRRRVCAHCSVAEIAARLVRPLRAADQPRQHHPAAPADAARADRLEPRPARRGRARAVPRGSRCSRAAGRSRRPRRWARAARSRRPTCSTSWRAWSRNRSWCTTRSPAAIGCSRRCASTRRSASTRPPTPTSRARDISSTTLALAERARPELFGPKQAPWLARLDQERENLLAAHACGRRRRGRRGVRDCASCRRCASTGSTGGCCAWACRSRSRRCQRPGAPGARRGAQPRVVRRGADLHVDGRVRAGAALPRGEPRHRARDRRLRRASRPRCSRCAIAALGEGDHAMALRYAEEAVALAREQPDRHRLAAALNALAQIHRLAGALDDADALYEQVLALSREIGNPREPSRSRCSTARSWQSNARRCDGRGCRCCARCCRSSTSRTHSRSAKASSRSPSGLAAAQGRYESAAWLYGAAEVNAARTGIGRDPADASFLRAHLARAGAALAPTAFGAAERAGRAVGYEATSRGPTVRWASVVDDEGIQRLEVLAVLAHAQGVLVAARLRVGVDARHGPRVLAHAAAELPFGRVAKRSPRSRAGT